MRKSINILALGLLFVFGACSTKDDANSENAKKFQDAVKDMEITLNTTSPFAPAFFSSTDGKTFTIKAIGNDIPAIVATFTAATDTKNAIYTTTDSKVYTIILGTDKAVSYQLAGEEKVSGFLRSEDSKPVVPEFADEFLAKVMNKEMIPVGGGGESIYAFFDHTAGTTFTTIEDRTNPRITMSFTTMKDANTATYTSTKGVIYTIILGDANAISYQAAGGDKIDGTLRARV